MVLHEAAKGGYNPVHFETLVANEDRHFWFRARNETISRVTTQLIAAFPQGYKVLEMGCGDGNVLRFLERVCNKGDVIGMDLYLEGLRYARSRTNCSLVQADVSRPPFNTQFDLVGMFDVLEHIGDDRAILRDIWKLLRPTGFFLLTVPAHARLWSYFDEVSGHCRRYEKNELRTKLEETGFEVEFLTEYMASIYPLMWLSRSFRLNPRTGQSGSRDLVAQELRTVPVVNGLLSFILSLEAKWLARRSQLPFGTSLLAVARKG